MEKHIERSEFIFAGISYSVIVFEGKSYPEIPENDCFDIFGKCPQLNFKYRTTTFINDGIKDRCIDQIKQSVEDRIRKLLQIPNSQKIKSEPIF